VFDSQLLRQALADVNLAAVPAIIRAACGMSQRDFGAMAGWSQATTSHYEHGTRDGMYDIRIALHFADAVGMPRAALLSLVLADADASLTPGEPGPVAVNAPQRATSAHARYWQACANALYAKGQSVDGAVLLPLALRQWKRARLAASDGQGETGGCLLAAAADLALCAGRIALDAGHLQTAQELFEESRELAMESGDAQLAVQVLASQSMLQAGLARTSARREPAREALHLAYQAQEEGRYLAMPQLHSLIALCHARAASLLGDKTAFQQAIAQAHHELDRGPQEENPPERLRFVDRTEISGVEARGWLDLGDSPQSAQLYRQLLVFPLCPRSRAVHGAGLIEALLRQGARDEAAAAANDMDMMTANAC
jgi:transcriptional regulator with XRE-family HTH domain